MAGCKLSVMIWCLSSMAITLSNGMTSSEKEELRFVDNFYKFKKVYLKDIRGPKLVKKNLDFSVADLGKLDLAISSLV